MCPNSSNLISTAKYITFTQLRTFKYHAISPNNRDRRIFRDSDKLFEMKKRIEYISNSQINIRIPDTTIACKNSKLIRPQSIFIMQYLDTMLQHLINVRKLIFFFSFFFSNKILCKKDKKKNLICCYGII